MKNRSQEPGVRSQESKHHAALVTDHASRLSLVTRHSSPVTRHSAFSLIEIMVTVALLSFIVLGLLAMFTQTKRAFTSSMTQTDVMESGRAVVEMIARELEQMTPGHVNNGNYRCTNFFAELSPGFNRAPANSSDCILLQGMPGTAVGTGQDRRTNIVQRFFFLSQNNLDWIGTGYQVLRDDPNAGGVGTLYRFSSTTPSRAAAPLLSSNFLYASSLLYSVGPAAVTNVNRLADGIVHLRIQAFATNGYPILPKGFLNSPDPNTPFIGVQNTLRYRDLSAPDQVDLYFFSNAVPAYVELELGILEPRVVERYRSMSPNRSAQLAYLSNHVAQVHIFRQRIPIRNVDFSVYQ